MMTSKAMIVNGKGLFARYVVLKHQDSIIALLLAKPVKPFSNEPYKAILNMLALCQVIAKSVFAEGKLAKVVDLKNA